jgi:hypothetical protein
MMGAKISIRRLSAFEPEALVYSTGAARRDVRLEVTRPTVARRIGRSVMSPIQILLGLQALQGMPAREPAREAKTSE